MRSRFGMMAGFMTCLLGCGSAAPALAPVRAPMTEAPSPAVRDDAASPMVTNALPRAGCIDGFRPSQQFLRRPWLEAYLTVKDASNIWLDEEDPTTPEAAREGLCLESSGIAGMPPKVKTTCGGDYWVITTDHLYYTDHTFVIVPRPDEAILFDAGQIGGGLCSGEQSGSLSNIEVALHGEILSIKSSTESFEWTESGPVAERCQRSHTDVADYRYDLSSDVGCEAFRVE